MTLSRFRISSGQAILWGGVALGVAVAVIGTFIPGGGMQWFLHAPMPRQVLPLSVALIAAGSVVRRLEVFDPAERRLPPLSDDEVERLFPTAPVPNPQPAPSPGRGSVDFARHDVGDGAREDGRGGARENVGNGARDDVRGGK